MCNQTKYQYISKMPLQCSWNLLDITVSAALSLVVGSDRHNFIHFQKSLVSLPDTSLTPRSLKDHRQKAVSYQNSSSLKPVEVFLQQDNHNSPICIHSHFKVLFPTGVLLSTQSKTQRHPSTAADWNKKWYLNHLFKKCETTDSLVSSNSTSTIKKPHAFWRTISTRVGGYHLCKMRGGVAVKSVSLGICTEFCQVGASVDWHLPWLYWGLGCSLPWQWAVLFESSPLTGLLGM